MRKKLLHTASFFALLISLSLSLSTVHFHNSIEHEVTPEANTSTTLTANTTFCPICGYLFNADTSDPVQPETHLRVSKELPFVLSTDYISPSFLRLKSRSPPVLG